MSRLRSSIIAAIMILTLFYALSSDVPSPFPVATAAEIEPFSQRLQINLNGTASPACSVSSNVTQVMTQTSTTTTGSVRGTVVPSVLNHTATMVAAVSASFVLHMEVVFKIQSPDQFSQCLAAISDPTSPLYRHFLNATTLAPFIETPPQKASIISFLKAKGFAVTNGPSPLVLNFVGAAAAVQNAFQVHLNFYRLPSKPTFYSADIDPTLPQNLANSVQAILGLENYTTVKPAETPCSGPYCAQAVEVGYSMNPLYSAAINGAGATVAVVDIPGDPNPCCNSTSALGVYDLQYGLNNPNFQTVCGDGTTWTQCNEAVDYDSQWASEAAMDIEALHSMAPGVTIKLFYGLTSFADPLVDAIDYIATNHIASIVSNSWIFDVDTNLDVSSVDSRLAVDAAQGLTILFASGDSGSDGGTIFPASDPNVLAVGATDLILTGCGTNTCTGYGSENGARISGGGYSGAFPEPSWQTATIGPTPSGFGGHGRGVPDVSMLGYEPGFWVYSTISGGPCNFSNVGAWYSCTGTSLSTPLWAGFLAVVSQLNGGMDLGNIDPLIYHVASGSRYDSDFHDITSGSNGAYSAGPGWDAVTGWGTPVADNLAMDLAPLHLTLTSAGGIVVNQGQAESTQVSVNLTLGRNVSTSLACVSGLPPRAFCAFNPSSSTSNYTSTLTVTTEPSTPAGSFGVVVTGTTSTHSGSVSNSTTITLTVNQYQQSCTQTSLASMYNCPLAFVQGWNLISLPVVPLANMTFPETVAGIFGSDPQFGFMSNVTDVFTYTNGVWQSCAVAKQGSGVNVGYTCAGSLKNLVDGKGYWVYAKAAFTLNNANSMAPTWGGLIGSVIPSLSLPPTYALNAGWNLVGYKPQPDATATENVTTYLQSLNGHYDLANVWIYDNVDQVWVRATPDTQLKPSEAMWIFMNSPATLRP